jgi:hypothetical protein
MLDLFMIQFIKKNWIWLVVILALLFGKNLFTSLFGISRVSSSITIPQFSSDSSFSSLTSSPNLGYSKSSAAPSESIDRIIIQDTSLSLQVKDVGKVITEIEDTTKKLGGFLINSSLSKPEGAASGNISVRIPEEKRKEALLSFKNMSVKVVSESVVGNDVTDQYVDLEAHLEVLNKTKIKYEDILQKAEKVDELLSVQRELTSLQGQIDNLKGQQKYYEQSAKLSKVVIYLSTDELALPYAPTNEWRPTVIFKDAVRSLIQTFRGLGSLIIWAVVYIPVIIPIILIIWFIKRKKQLKSASN